LLNDPLDLDPAEAHLATRRAETFAQADLPSEPGNRTLDRIQTAEEA
jgi:hypothetical protein